MSQASTETPWGNPLQTAEVSTDGSRSTLDWMEPFRDSPESVDDLLVSNADLLVSNADLVEPCVRLINEAFGGRGDGLLEELLLSANDAAHNKGFIEKWQASAMAGLGPGDIEQLAVDAATQVAAALQPSEAPPFSLHRTNSGVSESTMDIFGGGISAPDKEVVDEIVAVEAVRAGVGEPLTEPPSEAAVMALDPAQQVAAVNRSLMASNVQGDTVGAEAPVLPPQARLAEAVGYGHTGVLARGASTIVCYARQMGEGSQQPIRRLLAYAGGDNLYTFRRRVAAVTAGAVAIGTWLTGYWSPASMAQSICMTTLMPFMTEMAASPHCGAQVVSPGVFETMRQLAEAYIPIGGSIASAFGIASQSQTQRYDTAARAIYATITALVTVAFGSWTGAAAAAGSRVSSATTAACGIVYGYFGGATSSIDTLQELLLNGYEQLADVWGSTNFETALAIARGVGATPEELMAGGSIFEGLLGEVDKARQLLGTIGVDASTALPPGLGFNFTTAGATVNPEHRAKSLASVYSEGRYRPNEDGDGSDRSVY